MKYCVYCGKAIKKKDEEIYWTRGICLKCNDEEICFFNKWKEEYRNKIADFEGKAGISNRSFFSKEVNQWKKAVLERDNFTCKNCGEKNNLETHHIFNWADNPAKRFVIKNGITLCYKCHKEFHHLFGVKLNTRKQLKEFLNLIFQK